LRTQRVAAAVGRGTATWLPTFAIVAIAVLVAVLVGATSFWGLMANLGVLISTVAGLLGLLFAGLARLDLLSAPARPIQSAVEKIAIPVISGLGKLKKS